MPARAGASNTPGSAGSRTSTAGRWLRGFAYRVQPGVMPALLAVAFSLTIAFLSVAYKAIQAARANPVDSLRYE